MSVEFEALNNYRWLGVSLKTDVSRSPQCGKIADELVGLGPAHTEENRPLFSLICNAVSQEKVLQSLDKLHPVAVLLDRLSE